MLAIFALSTLASYNEYNCPDECGLYAPGDKVNNEKKFFLYVMLTCL